ncbi:hypothetical protein AB205_0143000 [Aquarana catesbeiana]|uniref:Uncharacterized protein n=1 Tax=Aquarana catesbeiana TaxID=8400 RepID=A0A2G9SJ83_AQUCT|nr:hypothetical protein AB205_0143000 [Aquarana catesbeiana]
MDLTVYISAPVNSLAQSSLSFVTLHSSGSVQLLSVLAQLLPISLHLIT